MIAAESKTLISYCQRLRYAVSRGNTYILVLSGEKARLYTLLSGSNCRELPTLPVAGSNLQSATPVSPGTSRLLRELVMPIVLRSDVTAILPIRYAPKMEMPCICMPEVDTTGLGSRP